MKATAPERTVEDTRKKPIPQVVSDSFDVIYACSFLGYVIWRPTVEAVESLGSPLETR